jgi:hypothetical protein
MMPETRVLSQAGVDDHFFIKLLLFFEFYVEEGFGGLLRDNLKSSFLGELEVVVEGLFMVLSGDAIAGLDCYMG